MDSNPVETTSGGIASPTSVVSHEPNQCIEPISLPAVKPNHLETWHCPASEKSQRTHNPIRAIVDPIAKSIQSGEDRDDNKEPISLALGDPTVGGNLPPCPLAIQKIVQNVQSRPHAAGYTNACGTSGARRAIAQFHSYPENSISEENVIVASGCSGALELALTAILDPDSVLLVPKPGFPLYQVIAESHGARVVHYKLDPERSWECDIEHLEALMKEHKKIRAIVINNPSNPTGSVFQESHLIEIANFCRRHRMPVISDEVYGSLVFEANEFHPMAKVAAKLGRHVPVITASGLAKQFLLPGWRVGWLAFHDNLHCAIKDIQDGAKRLAQVILGASHLSQSIIPTLLDTSNRELYEWRKELCSTLEHQANFLCTKLGGCNGITIIKPQGAMYAMVKIDSNVLDIQDDVEFAEKLLKEENIFVLPGTAFGAKLVFRVVFCSPENILDVAATRILDFCIRHSQG